MIHALEAGDRQVRGEDHENSYGALSAAGWRKESRTRRRTADSAMERKG